MRPAANHWTITAVNDISAPGCDLIRKWLREYIWTKHPAFMAQLNQPEHQSSSLILIASADACVVGGVFAETQLAWLRISIMAVSPKWRSRGIETALLAEAERQSIAHGCRHAYVDTMDYQAPRFYFAHGFTVVGEIADWDSHGHSKLYLAKHLKRT